MKNQEYTVTEQDRRFMAMACRLAEENVERGGGPFGAVIVRDGRVVATGVNTVTIDNDPTAHAEVNAIRNACQGGQTYSLKGCVIYSSCEPCPMCLSAIYWSGISRLYYGNTQDDAADIDFDDSFIYRQIALPKSERYIPAVRIEDAENIRAFEMWAAKPDKKLY